MNDELKLRVAGYVRSLVRENLELLKNDNNPEEERYEYQVYSDLRGGITVKTQSQGTRLFEIVVKEVM